MLFKIDTCQSFIQLSNKIIEYLKVVISVPFIAMGVRLGRFRNTCFCLKVCFCEINVVGIQNEFHSVLEFSSLIHSKNSVTW